MSAESQYLEVLPEAPDEWHRHSAAEGAPQSEHAGHVSARALWVAFGAMVVFLVVVIGALSVYYNRYMTDLKRDRMETTGLAEEHGLEYESEAKASLDRYGVVNEEAGTYQIPIEDAMDKVVERYSSERGESPGE